MSGNLEAVSHLATVSASHFSVALGDAADAVCEGRLLDALSALANGTNLSSLGTVIQNTPSLSRLARLG